MRIMTGAPFTLLSEGRKTLQVPQYSHGFKDDPSYTDYPDEYFVEAKFHGVKHRICVGREDGCMFMSRLGFEHFKPELKKAFESSTVDRGHTWQDVLDHADEFYAEMRTKSQEQLIRLQCEVQIKNTPYNRKRVTEMTDRLTLI